MKSSSWMQRRERHSRRQTQLRADRKKISKEIGALMGQGKKEEAEQLKNQVNADAEKLEQLSEKEKEAG